MSDTEAAPVPFDADFLQKSEAVGTAEAWPVADDGEYDMICTESVRKMNNAKNGYNWMVSFMFKENTAEREQYGKMRFSTWIPLTPRSFPRIVDMYKALYDSEWPETGLDKAEMDDMIKNGKGRSALVTIEVAEHYKAETDDAFEGVKQNNIVGVASPELVGEDQAAFFQLPGQ